MARQSALMARGALRRPRRLDEPRVVVFVHGFMATGPVFDPMRVQVGHRVSLPSLDFSYSPLAVSFDRVTRRLERHLDEHIHPHTTVSLVGHSMGGLVARSYLQEHAGGARVDRVVTIATPHAGTEAARGIPGPLAAGLAPGGAIVERLARGYEAVRHVPHTAIVAGRDHLVRPPESAAALDGATVHWLEDVSHNEILFDERAHDLVVEALSTEQ